MINIIMSIPHPVAPKRYFLILIDVLQVIRDKAFGAVLRQHMGWFDQHQAGEINTRLTRYVIIYCPGEVVRGEYYSNTRLSSYVHSITLTLRAHLLPTGSSDRGVLYLHQILQLRPQYYNNTKGSFTTYRKW